MSTKLAWELNTGGPALGRPLDLGICYGTLGPMVTVSEIRALADLGPLWTVAPKSLVFNKFIFYFRLAFVPYKHGLFSKDSKIFFFFC